MTDPIKQAIDALAEARKWFSTDGPLAQQLEAALSALQQAQQQPSDDPYMLRIVGGDVEIYGEGRLNPLVTMPRDEAARRLARPALRRSPAVPPYEFRRFVHGEEMAEGVKITHAASLDEAIRKAVRMYPERGTVLVVSADAPAVPEGWKLVQIVGEGWEGWCNLVADPHVPHRPVMLSPEAAAFVRSLMVAAAPPPPEQMEGGVVAEIAAERRRQVEAEGWTPEHDDQHSNGELAAAASCYTRANTPVPGKQHRMSVPLAWPWDDKWWKPKDRRRDLIRAAALIVAEIERLDRASPPSDHPADVETSTDDSKRSANYHRGIEAVKDLARRYASKKQED